MSKDACEPSPTPKPERSKPLPWSTRLLFALGDGGQGICLTVIGFNLNAYLLEVCCMDPADVSLIQLVQGLFDVFNDPLIGYMSDHTRTRWGRRRPWLLFGGPFLALAYFGLWNKLPNDIGRMQRFFYYLFCYCGTSVGMTSVTVQMSSLTPELTDDYDERTLISAIRLIAIILFGAVAVVAQGLIQMAVPSKADGYRLGGAVFAIVILLCTWSVFFGIRETFKPDQEHGEKMSYLREIGTVFRNRAFLCVIMIYLCGPTAIVLIQTNLYMLCKYVVKKSNVFIWVVLAVQGFCIASGPVWIRVSKIGKRQLLFFGGPLLSAVFIAIYFVEDEVLAIIAGAGIGMGVAVVYLAPFSMLPDVIEDDELKTGKRREGLFSGFFTVSLKLTVTLALTFTNVLLKISGYESPKGSCDDLGEETENDEIQTQPDAVILCLKLLSSLVPAFLVIVAIFFAWAYPINRETQAQMAAEVKVKRTSNMMSSVSTTEIGLPSSGSSCRIDDTSAGA